SFFERLHSQLPASSKYFLSEQFRMPRDIGNLVGEMFYKNADGLTILTNGQIKDESNFLFSEAIAWIDVPGAQEQEGTSKKNMHEVTAITDFIRTMKAKGTDRKNIEVAIITPYSAQRRAIRKAVSKISDSTNDGVYNVGSLNIKIDTVDSFQGSEADIVLYSVVRTKGDLSFILDWRRLNVACSRAKENLFFFGHIQFLRHKRVQDEERNLFFEILSRIPKENCWISSHLKNIAISTAN
ncbi:MAG TPA: AAA domain-containing protein, partial [Cellvibrionaceae bacterium]|nr:AAA domain-containing protein [Cellvibrionaceae bacterium]